MNGMQATPSTALRRHMRFVHGCTCPSIYQHKGKNIGDRILRQKITNPFININFLLSSFFSTTMVPISLQSISLVVWEKIDLEI